MAVSISITCDWTHQTIQGGEGTKVPDTWVKEKGPDPQTAGRTETTFYFVNKEAQKEYWAAHEEAIIKAEEEYAKHYFNTMNQLRQARKK